MKAVLSLIRPEFPAMTFAGVLFGAAVATKSFAPAFALAAIGPALITAGSFALNDYFDVASDRKLGRKDRPLVSGAMHPAQVLIAGAAMMLAGLGLSYYFSGALAFAIAFVFGVLALAYNAWLKKTLVVGNVAVSTTYAIPFIYGNIIAAGNLGELNQFVLLFAAVAFLAGLGREFLNSIKDMAGDKKLGALSLPMFVGARPVIAIAAVLFAAAIFLSLIPMASGIQLPYLALVGACDLLLLKSAYSAWNDYSYENLAKVRKWTIYALVLGVIGFATLAL
jgi:4-hydroxybenzoate polyprenyltransferase